jgi:hypothetical protein
MLAMAKASTNPVIPENMHPSSAQKVNFAMNCPPDMAR